ncbi:ribonuclease-III-like-domain-containing protein, partial [Trichophaea hybrida]
YTHTKRFQNARPQPRAPVSVRVRKHFAVNDDPKVLDAMYAKLFGKELGLPGDVKWQAVTHKSFDHGRQPFNSKLRFLGKRLLQMQASFHLLSSQPKPTKEPKPSIYKSLEGAQYKNPEPFTHEDYQNIDAVTRPNIDAAISEEVLMPIIRRSGLASTMRWKPADDTDLTRSGEAGIAIDCLHAIIGAVALQKGGDVAVQFIRETILKT